MANRSVAIDIGTTMVRVAEVELRTGVEDGREGATLHAFAEKPIPPGVIRDGVIDEPAALAAVVRDTMNLAKPSTKKVTVGVGHPSIVVREVDIPAQPMDKVRESLAFHVQDQVPMAPDEVLLDFYPTMELEAAGGSSLRGLMVAAPREHIRDLVDAMGAAGVSVVGIDHSALGLWRAGCRAAYMETNVALVNVGATTTTVVVSQHGAPRLVRTLGQASNDATRAIANYLKGMEGNAEALKRQVGMDQNVSPEHRGIAEASSHALAPLIEAIRNTLVYFQASNPGGGIERVILTGGGSYVRGFGQELASATRIAVRIGEPLSGLRLGKKADLRALQGREAELATVIGLAMGGAR